MVGRLRAWAMWRSVAAVAGAAAILASGCAVGSNFHSPNAPDLPRYTRPSLATTTASSDVAGGEEQISRLASSIAEGVLVYSLPLVIQIEGFSGFDQR